MLLQEHIPGQHLEVISPGLLAPDLAAVTGVDLWLKTGGKGRFLLVGYVPVMRLSDLLGRIAVVAVQLTSIKKSSRPVLLFGAPSVGARAVEAVASFMASHLGDWEWGLFGDSGSVRLHIPSLGTEVSFNASVRSGPAVGRKSAELFSDLNSLMLKILMLRGIGEKYWGGPTEAPRTPTDLHRIARVSIETAHRFVRTFEERGFLRRAVSGLQLVRAEELLDSWLVWERTRQHKSIPLVWFPRAPATLTEAFAGGPAGVELLVGGFEACKRLELLHATPGILQIHAPAGGAERQLGWDVEDAGLRSPDLVLLDCRRPRSIFSGKLRTEDLPTVDILQAAFDVVHSNARGVEQAGFLVDRILSSIPRSQR